MKHTFDFESTSLFKSIQMKYCQYRLVAFAINFFQKTSTSKNKYQKHYQDNASLANS